MTLSNPDLIDACVQTIAEVLTPVVLLCTVIFALRAPRPGKVDE